MLLFYIRHGQPIYDPDSLTELGQKQADALAKRLKNSNIDVIYSSTSGRAMQTAKATAKALNMDIIPLDWAHEIHAWDNMYLPTNGKKEFAFLIPEVRESFVSSEVRSLDKDWAKHPDYADTNFGIFEKTIGSQVDDFLLKLGYEHIRNKNCYRVINDNEKRIALFAHQGMGMSILSQILDIPYPMFAAHFDMSHTGMTVIEFKNENGYCIPKMLQLSNDSHLYKEDLLTGYNGVIKF